MRLHRLKLKRNDKFYFPNMDHRVCRTCGKIVLLCQCPPPPPKMDKTCPGCNTALLFAAFGKDTRRKDGHRPYCIQCETRKRRERRANAARRMGHTAMVAGSDADAGPTEPFA